MVDRVSAEELQHDLRTARHSRKYQDLYRGVHEAICDTTISIVDCLSADEINDFVTAMECTNDLASTLAEWRSKAAHKMTEKEMERGV